MFSLYYQTVLDWRLVSLGGEVVLPRHAATPSADGAPSTSVRPVLRVGGMWQVTTRAPVVVFKRDVQRTHAPASQRMRACARVHRAQTSRRSAIKARVASDGVVGAVMALHTSTWPAWTVLVSAEASVTDPLRASRLGVSVVLSQ